METKILTEVNVNPKVVDVRNLSKEDWIAKYASGTLRHSHDLGLRAHSLYLEERTAFEFGWEFRIAPSSRVLFNDLMAEGDCPAITELVWHTRRAQALSRFDGDTFVPKYIHLTVDGEQIEGAGILVTATSAPWIPAGHLIFAFVATWTKKEGWAHPVNPL